MTTAEGTIRKVVSIYNYPEHLNPFYEEDNNRRLRFWTLGRKKERSNSFSFSTLKDFRNNWNLRSFRKKDSNGLKSNISCISAQNSPEVYRRNLNVSTNSTPTLNRQVIIRNSETNGCLYPGLVTPLPRSRFQERVSHLSNQSTSSQERSSLNEDTIQQNGTIERHSRHSCNKAPDVNAIKNPFDENEKNSVRVSIRKKRRAPLPPTVTTVSTSTVTTPTTFTTPTIPSILITDMSEDTNCTKTQNTVQRKLFDESSLKDDIDVEDPSLQTELRIVEDCDTNKSHSNVSENDISVEKMHIDEEKDLKIKEDEYSKISHIDEDECKISEDKNKQSSIIIDEESQNHKSDNVFIDNNVNEQKFPKVNIKIYKTRQSVDDDNESLEKSILQDMNENRNLKTIDLNINEYKNDNEKVNDDSKNEVALPYSSEKYDEECSEMEEFKEFNKIIKCMENAEQPQINGHGDVSNLIMSNSPNPIPKPRRSKLSTQSSDESAKSSVSSSPKM